MGDATASYPGVVPPPEGIIPDVNNPQDANHSLLLGWLVTATALTTIFFFARVYAKVVYLKRIVSEDSTPSLSSPVPLGPGFLLCDWNFEMS